MRCSCAPIHAGCSFRTDAAERDDVVDRPFNAASDLWLARRCRFVETTPVSIPTGAPPRDGTREAAQSTFPFCGRRGFAETDSVRLGFQRTRNVLRARD